MATSDPDILAEKPAEDGSGRTIYIYPLIMGTARISIGNDRGFDNGW